MTICPEGSDKTEKSKENWNSTDVTSLRELLINENLIAIEAVYSIFAGKNDSAATTLSCIAEINFLSLQTSKADIVAELSLLGFNIGQSYKGIILKENHNFCNQKAKIVFNNKLLALGFYRKTDGKFLSNLRNVCFCKIDQSEELSQNLISDDITIAGGSSDLCCISMTYSQECHL